MTQHQDGIMFVEATQDPQPPSLRGSTTIPHYDNTSSEPPTSASTPTPEDMSMDRTRETSWSSAPAERGDDWTSLHSSPPLSSRLVELFAENITAKACRTATKSLEDQIDAATNSVRKTPIAFPETVPQSGPGAGLYEFRDPDFWTCGFFPGTLYALFERSIKHPRTMHLSSASQLSIPSVRAHLQSLCAIWSEPLHGMSSRTDTHDIGFIVMPALQRAWGLTGDQRSLDSISRAARSLATRFVPAAGAIRSWDCLLKKDITVTDMTTNLLAIVDSLCNLDLLYYAAAHTGDGSLAEVASTHARTLLRTHFRPEAARTLAKDGYTGQLYSTCHVANIDPATGELKWRWTAQGYANDSTWARGQAWAVLGYAQTYLWTKEQAFLEAACGVAEYFLYRLDTAPSCVDVPAGEGKTCGRRVPLWDFDAPVEGPGDPLRDSSAGVIAANGMLLLSQALRGVQKHALAKRFLEAAVEIVADTLEHSLASEKAMFARAEHHAGVVVEDAVAGERFDGILKNGTANNNENARRRYSNHALVYGDYYLVEFGNRLLNMSLV